MGTDSPLALGYRPQGELGGEQDTEERPMSPRLCSNSLSAAGATRWWCAEGYYRDNKIPLVPLPG